MARNVAPGTAALRKRGRKRLMLRIPEHSRALADATGENFLDLCEGYELAWKGVDHWSNKAPAGHELSEYFVLIEALEAEAIALVSKG